MNKTIALGVFSMALMSHTVAHAQCSGTPLTNTQLNGFSGKTVSYDCVDSCEPWMLSTSPDWHETHVAGGTLEEVGKEGTADEHLQPRAVVGGWSIGSIADGICYTYTGDTNGPYCYTVYGVTPVISGESYSFCIGALHKATGTVD